MKILFVAEGMDIGGCETHIYELVRELLSRSHSITLVCTGGRYAKKLEELGVRVVILPTSARGVVSMLRVMHGLIRLRGEGFDVVHAHTRAMALFCSLLLRAPMAVTVHLDFRTNALLRRVCRFGDATLAVSEDIREYLKREYGIRAEEVIVTHNGVDLARFRDCRAKEHAIVHSSRLDRDRSLTAHLLCEIAPYLLREYPSVKIHIFGDGNDMPRVRKKADAANLALGREGVVLHGATTDIYGALSLGDIFVGVSRAALEGMSARRATVICGNEGYGGILSKRNVKELMHSNFCARGFDPASARKLMIDLSYLISHDVERAAAAAFANEIATRYYGTPSMADDAERAYATARERYFSRALLVGYYGYGNFGDTMTLKTLLDVLPYREIHVLYRTKKKTPESTQDGRRIFYHNRYFGVLRAMRRAKVVIFGGGTLFQNQTSNRSLLYYCALSFLGKLYGRRLVLLGAGVDGIRGRWQSALARRALLRFDALSVRTEYDRMCMRALSESLRPIHLPDVVFLSGEHRAGMLPYVCFLLHGAYSHEEISYAVSAVRSLGLSPLFVALFFDEDAAVCLKMARHYGAKAILERDAEKIFSLLSHASLTVSERLHGAIASVLCRRACFLLRDGKKRSALCEDASTLADCFQSERCICSFDSYRELTGKRLSQAIQKAAGNSCGFDKLIGYCRMCYRERLMPLLQEQQPLGASPWEPSSSMRAQQRPQEP